MKTFQSQSRSSTFTKMVAILVLTLTNLFSFSHHQCHAFTNVHVGSVLSTSSIATSTQPKQHPKQQQFHPQSTPFKLTLNAIPTIDNWELTRDGSAVGRVSNHPDPGIYDGELVTTSPLKNNKASIKEGATVITASGSKYKLGRPKNTPQPLSPSAAASASASSAATINKSSPSISFGGNWGLSSKKKQVPIINDWFVSFRGEVIGVVTGHPDRQITDGETITTSKINQNRNSIKEGDVITTSSGSQYQLGLKKKGTNLFNTGVSSASAESNGGTFKSGVKVGGGESPVSAWRSFQLRKPKDGSNQLQEDKDADNSSSSSNPFGTFGLISAAFSNRNSSTTSSSSSTTTTTTSGSVVSSKKLERERLRKLKEEYGINGKTLANGKYLLCDRPKRSTSGKSNIWSAYKADENGNPVGEKLTIKISTNYDSMTREDSNYNKVTSGLFPGRFVEKTAFLDVLDGYPVKEFETSCALIIENGKKDLRAILNERGLRGFEGRAMRDAASAALQCIQAMHSSGIVWTDLKIENFVIVSDEIGDNGTLPGVKGIDLESAIPRGKNPVDFSPEACPPEFATAFISGQGLAFTLDYSYDIWSYGMLLYELTTGKPYFDGKTPAQITMLLQYEFEPDLSNVTDEKLRDLIRLCLQYDPKKRPGVAQLLLHPYFLSYGIGPFAW